MTSIDLTKTGKPDDDEPERKPVGELQPLLPAWMRDRTQLVDTTRKATQRGAHRATWHLLRVPVYVVRLLLMSPRGLWRVVKVVFGILSDGQGHQLRVEAATSSEGKMWLDLRKERNERIHRRMLVAACLGGPVALFVLAAMAPTWFARLLGLVVFLWIFRQLGDLVGFGIAIAAGGLLAWFLPGVMPVPPLPAPGVLWLGLSLALLGLGWVGRPIGKPLVKPATVLAGNHGPIRAPYVMEALCSLGIAGLNEKTMDQIGLLFDVARVGPGYQVDLQLPRGVAATAVIERRGKLSAALRRELGTVWPSVGKRHEGHLSLYVCDQPMTEAKQAPWKLARDGAVDLFAPVPMFTDQRGQWVDLTFAYANIVVGSVPRQGKTYLVRQALLVAGLDPRAQVYAIDGKGTGDLSPCSLYAHFYSVGEEPEEVERVLVALRGLRQELRRRARVIRGLSRDECPESKVTSILASRRDLRLEPIVVGIDETQCYFEDQPKAIRDELVAIVTDLVKRGPALGIIIILATQNVTATTIPTPISNNAVIRFCLKVFGHTANDQVLGTGAFRAGIDATMFAPEDKGIGYLRADGADAKIVRTVVGLNAPASEKVARRARSLRAAAGRLTGQALGDVMDAEAEQVVLLDDCREVMDTGRAKRMHLGELRDKLALLRPGIYGHLDNDSLGSMLRQAGVTPGTVWSPLAKRDGWGVKRESLDVSTTEVIGLVPDDEQDDESA